MAATSYAMFWWIGEGPRKAGRVEVNDESVSFASTTPTATVERVSFSELAGVVLERNVLHLERQADPPVHVGSLDAPGALRELAGVLSHAAADGAR